MVVKEMIRQNKTICLERGKLMETIWNSNIQLFAVAEELQHKECDDIKEQFDENMSEAEVKWTDELDKLKNSLDSKDAKIAKLERDIWKKEKKMNQIKKDIEYEQYKYREMKSELEGSIMGYEKELGINQPKYADIELDDNMLSQEEFEKMNAVADREKELSKVRCKLKKPEKRGFADD